MLICRSYSCRQKEEGGDKQRKGRFRDNDGLAALLAVRVLIDMCHRTAPAPVKVHPMSGAVLGTEATPGSCTRNPKLQVLVLRIGATKCGPADAVHRRGRPVHRQPQGLGLRVHPHLQP